MYRDFKSDAARRPMSCLKYENALIKITLSSTTHSKNVMIQPKMLVGEVLHACLVNHKLILHSHNIITMTHSSLAALKVSFGLKSAVGSFRD